MSYLKHKLDCNPIPRDEIPTYINEPCIIDASLLYLLKSEQFDSGEDNVRVYLPMDISRDSILRRLNFIINKYGEASEYNEMIFSAEVEQVIGQFEIYDQVWIAREGREGVRHSNKGTEVIKEIIETLEDIPDGCAELFPFELIDELKAEYLI